MRTDHLPLAARRASPGRRGFTMVEMLVTVAIITLLFSILANVVGTARDSAKRVMCANNVRGLVAGCIAFATENDGRLPYCNWATQESGAGASGWLYKAPLPPGQAPPDYMRTGSIWKYVANPDVYHCPMAPGPYPEVQRTASITGYLMNGAVNGYGDPKNPWTRLSEFRPDGIYIWEAQEDAGVQYNDGSSYPHESDTKRHTTGSTYGCFDGRAEYIRTPDFIDMRNLPAPNRLICYPRTGNGRAPL